MESVHRQLCLGMVRPADRAGTLVSDFSQVYTNKNRPNLSHCCCDIPRPRTEQHSRSDYVHLLKCSLPDVPKVRNQAYRLLRQFQTWSFLSLRLSICTASFVPYSPILQHVT